MPDPGDAHAELARLRDSYAGRLPGRIADIRRAWESLPATAWRAEDLQRLARDLHGLVGTGGSFGFGRVSEVASALDRQLQRVIKQPRPPEPRLCGEISVLLGRLEAAALEPDPAGDDLSSDVPSIEQQRRVGAKGRVVFLVEDDTDLSAWISGQLQHFGYQVRAFPSLAGLEEAIHATPPDALVVDMVLPEGFGAGGEVVARVKRGIGRHMPVVFASARIDMEARVAAVRAGGSAYFTKPLDIHGLVDCLDDLTGQPEPYRILVCQRSARRASVLAGLLGEAGMQVRVVSDPLQLMQPLIDFKPDLLLVADDLEFYSSAEIAAVIEQDRAFSDRPVAFLTTGARGDDDPSHPIGGDAIRYRAGAESELVEAVRSRASRARSTRALMTRDGLTGLLSHSRLKERLAAEIVRARRYGGQLVFAMVDIDRFKQVNDQYGHPVGDRVIKSLARLLQERLRRSDIIGRYGGEEFGVILSEVDLAQAADVMDKVRIAFERLSFQARDGTTFSVTFSCGLAAWPEWADSETICAAADEAMYEAKAAGRNCVRSKSTA